MAFIKAYINAPLLPPLVHENCLRAADLRAGEKLSALEEANRGLTQENYSTMKLKVDTLNDTSKLQRQGIVFLSILFILGIVLSASICAVYWKNMSGRAKVGVLAPLGGFPLILGGVFVWHRMTVSEAKAHEGEYYKDLRKTYLNGTYPRSNTVNFYLPDVLDKIRQNWKGLLDKLGPISREIVRLEAEIEGEETASNNNYVAPARTI